VDSVDSVDAVWNGLPNEEARVGDSLGLSSSLMEVILRGAPGLEMGGTEGTGVVIARCFWLSNIFAVTASLSLCNVSALFTSRPVDGLLLFTLASADPPPPGFDDTCSLASTVLTWGCAELLVRCSGGRSFCGGKLRLICRRGGRDGEMLWYDDAGWCSVAVDPGEGS
jgi:hypothetical protein